MTLFNWTLYQIRNNSGDLSPIVVNARTHNYLLVCKHQGCETNFGTAFSFYVTQKATDLGVWFRIGTLVSNAFKYS